MSSWIIETVSKNCLCMHRSYALIFFVLSSVVIIFLFFIVFLEKVQYMERNSFIEKRLLLVVVGDIYWLLFMYWQALIYVLACVGFGYFCPYFRVFQIAVRGEGVNPPPPPPQWVKGKEPE